MSTPQARLLSLLAWCAEPARPLALVLAVLLAAPVPIAMALVPAAVVNFAQHDFFIPLDAGWRTLQGQWPHTDFYTPLGLSYFWMHGAAAWLWGLNARLVIRATLVVLPLALVPALILSARRLGAFATILLMMVLAILITSPTFVDGPEQRVADLADYNGVGNALSAVVCLWALCPPRTSSRAWGVIETLLMSLVLLFLLYLKVTFFVLAAGTMAIGFVTVRGFWRSAIGAVLLVTLGSLALELLHPGLTAAYLADMRRTGAASGHLFRGWYAPEAVIVNSGVSVVIIALAALGAWLSPRHRWRICGTLVVVVAAIGVATQNFGAFSAPLVVLVLLLAQILEQLPLGADPAGGLRPVLRATGVAVAIMAAGPFLRTQLEGTVYALKMTHARAQGVAVAYGQSKPLQDLVWFPDPEMGAYLPSDFTPASAVRWRAVLPVDIVSGILADGIALLRRDGLDHMRIENLAFSNPFPYALQAPSPHGVALWLDFERTFTAATTTPEQLFGDAQVVMVPKLWWWYYEDTAVLAGIAQSRLQQDFVPHESQYWTAWVRK